MTQPGRICPIPPDDDPVAWAVGGLIVLAVLIPGGLLLAAFIVGSVAEMIFG